ncbi:palindromic element RPE2 domain-containing protein [Candidatus Tisiphia endosymbiont of Nedyus quadrimaculatus]|uniref:palindromic element RPE2 domain-containing protein n=1 Tax=Candidatus Tisiphia endosymbiont of Nedyus quadrimaculatus TaxID=3139332 RepID=UPI00345E2205
MKAITIVNSGELDSRNDGAKPIDNRRAIEDDVTKFLSIDYTRLSLLRLLARSA